MIKHGLCFRQLHELFDPDILSVSIYLLAMKWINNKGNVCDSGKQMIDIVSTKTRNILVVTNVSYNEIYLLVHP